VWAASARAARTPLAAPLAASLLDLSAARVAAQVTAWVSARARGRATLRALAAAPPATTRRDVARRARARAAALAAVKSAVLVVEAVEEGGGGGGGTLAVVAALALLRRSVGAALPPPAPTTAPRVAYVASVATSPAWRRRGAATALLARAAARAGAWRDASLWLDARPAGAAAALYARVGFGEPPQGSLPAWAGGRGLRVARVEPRALPPVALDPAPPAAAAGSDADVSTGGSEAVGVYVWRVGDSGDDADGSGGEGAW
jgi:GNAT superfamily N-acetyltransferase